jgi:hypothetical protein
MATFRRNKRRFDAIMKSPQPISLFGEDEV